MNEHGACGSRVALLAVSALVSAVVASFSATAWGSANAGSVDFAGVVARAHGDVIAAKGPARYGAVRELWRLWDDGDPQYIEAALQALASDVRLDVPARAYVSFYAADARRRRGDLQGAMAQIAGLGFVSQWLVVGPFDNEGRSGLDRVYGPEQALIKPLDVQQVFEGKERQTSWRSLPQGSVFGNLNFGQLMRPDTRVCGFASTFVRSTADKLHRATIWIGATGAFRLFFNGEQVLHDGLYRTVDVDRFATTVILKPGWNQLVVKACGDAVAPVVAVRLADEKGAPDGRLQSSADPSHATEAAANLVTRNDNLDRSTLLSERPVVEATGVLGSVRGVNAPVIRARDPGPVLGPVPQFEKLLANQQVSAATLQAYAQYLYSSGGDDSTQQQALTYVSRAIDKQPTFDRVLLAYNLAEDRNQKHLWLEKAATLDDGTNTVKLLLAKARLAGTGPHAREAIPLFEQVLARSPDNIDALLGFVHLYNKLGLTRTALALLQKAVERNSRSVALLRSLEAQLSQLSRTSEAQQVYSRSSLYRFNDGNRRTAQLNHLVARGQQSEAIHEIERLLAIEPHSVAHWGIAASAYMGLGQPDKAIAAYQHALALAPEDTDMMIGLSGLLALLGQQQQQAYWLRKVIELRPQRTDVREYLEYIEPRQPRADEKYAWNEKQFLPLRTAPAGGYSQRVLRDLHVTTVYPSGLSSEFRQVVFQPLTEEAAVAARQYAFVYHADRQTVQLQAARVYRADGRVDETIETGQGPADDPSIAMYTSARIFYVRFPKLMAGDVVELRYRTEEVSPDNVFGDYFGQVVPLQSSQPVSNAEYVVIAPTSRQLRFNATALEGLKQQQTTLGSSTVYRFFVPKVAPVLPQPNMPPWSEILGHVHVSTYASWKDVGDWYWGLSKDQLHPDEQVRKKALELTAGMTSDVDKVRAIYGWVVKRTRYVALEFGIYGYKPRRASQTLARGWGDCKDKAALLVSMLQVVGIPANLVIARTGMRGDFPQQPASLAPFDHAIAYVPSLDLFLDGTADYTGTTEFPAFDRGGLALIVAPGASKLVRLPDPPASDTQRTRKLRATLQPDGSARIRMTMDLSGVAASQWRISHHGETTRRDRVAADAATTFPGFVLDADKRALEVSDLENIEEPVQVKLSGRSRLFARTQADELSVPVTPSERLVARYASQSQRFTDVVLPYRSTVNESWTIELPATMAVRELPKSTQISTQFGTLSLQVTHVHHTVEVKTRLTFDKRRITPTQYSAFAKFCEQVDRALNQRLIVSK